MVDVAPIDEEDERRQERFVIATELRLMRLVRLILDVEVVLKINKKREKGGRQSM
jgi:hypothetical protein